MFPDRPRESHTERLNLRPEPTLAPARLTLALWASEVAQCRDSLGGGVERGNERRRRENGKGRGERNGGRGIEGRREGRDGRREGRGRKEERIGIGEKNR